MLADAALADYSQPVRIYRDIAGLSHLKQPLHLAMGVFDGLHLGHQAVIAKATAAAQAEGGLSGVVTFHPHPIQVLAPSKAPKLLLADLQHQAELLETMGVDFLLAWHFDYTLARTSADDFLNQLLTAHVRTIAIGEDWRFGYQRQGDRELLQNRAGAYQLIAVPAVMLDGQRISSSLIRTAVKSGDLTKAAHWLGRPYEVRGKVIRGQQLGRTLGFPTANIACEALQLPPDGVWAVEVTLTDRRRLGGVANLGMRPTVGGNQHSLEVHCFGLSEDLYEQSLTVRFLQWIRNEQSFASLDALKAQIHLDGEAAKVICKIND